MPGATLGAVPLTSLKDRTAVVTGGASGIGRALALLSAREGANVVVADLDEAGMAETVAAVSQAGRRGLAVKTDVSRLAAVQALANRAFGEFGAVHVVCNNAGVALWGGLESVTHKDWEWAMGVNLWGVIHGVEAFVPRMVAGKKPGHDVNTASMAGLIASQGLGIYNTTTSAVVEGWGKLPDGWAYHEVAGVAVDKQDRAFVFTRGEHPVIVFDRDGNFLRSWGEGVIRRAHGITLDADDMVWLTDDLHHTVRKFTPEAKHLLTIGDPDTPAQLHRTDPFNHP